MKQRTMLVAGGLAVLLGGVALGLTFRLEPLSAKAAAGGRDTGPAEQPAKMVASRITHVTVYPDSALVTREVEIPEGGGLVEVVVNPLPPTTINSSLYSEGSDGIRVLSTRFRNRPVKEDTREEVRKLEDEQKRLIQLQQKLQADMRACEANAGLLGKLENFTTVSTTHATEKGKLDSDATIALAKFLMDGRSERAREMIALQQQQQTNQENLEFVQRKLRELTAGTSKVERDAVIVVDKANGGVGKVRLNYLVGAAAWRPQYKFRSGRTTKDPVVVEYLAALMQQTGEDWSRVDLTLSTAQPMLNAAPPELKTLAVAIIPRGSPMPPVSGPFVPGQPGAGAGALGGAISNPAFYKASTRDLAKAAQEVRQQAQRAANTNKDLDAQALSNYAATLDQANELVLVEEKKALNQPPGSRAGNNEGPSVTYHLANKLSVPSRNDDQVIEVTKLDLNPDYFYKAVPVLTQHVYRQANLMNKSKYVLLPGEATMYNGNDFVGRMNLPLVAIGEEFTVGFGAEPQLQVQRQMLDKSRTMQGGNQILKYDYRILISSYKGERVKVQVWDRLPHAENEALGVSLIKATPELCKDPVYEREDRTNNLLRWDLEIEPEMKGERAFKINYEFKLELDKQATIGSFQSK
jgi:hypothetical protein